MSAGRKKGKVRITITIDKEDKPKIRFPSIRKTGGFHSTRKGKRGYNRRNAKKNLRKEISNE